MKKEIDWVNTILMRGLPVFLGSMFLIGSMIMAGRYNFNFIIFEAGVENNGWEIIFNVAIWYVIVMKSVEEIFNNLKLEYKK
ncbi:hypothetical protein LCGC14_1371190 [marine sediment metagenome]|uniref:Uncharacterized protein n=1 Tax=marine sediment metagenome TaxID=412755 RepID=A0A0F9N7C3_9ZZZZ